MINRIVDKNFCMSSFLGLRYVEKEFVDFSEKLKYRHPRECIHGERILVNSASEIDVGIKKQLSDIKGSYKKIGILLSGGMDSAILASYLSGCDAYTFRFLGGKYQEEELIRAKYYSHTYGLNLHYVDIDWSIVLNNLPAVMMSKGGPVHSIETQICQAAKQAKADGIDLMIIGDGSDYVFGGMDQLLAKDWNFAEFYKRFIYVEPEEVLNNPVSLGYLFERYRHKDKIDYLNFLDIVATEESYGSYSNAFFTAGLAYYDPYACLKLFKPLDLTRIRHGESKYYIRELFHLKYPNIDVPNKLPMPRPVDFYFSDWRGPTREEFRPDIDINKYNGNQKWLIWCLEQFLNMLEE